MGYFECISTMIASPIPETGQVTLAVIELCVKQSIDFVTPISSPSQDRVHILFLSTHVPGWSKKHCPKTYL